MAELTCTFTREQLMDEHDYAQPHEILGRRMHGGFDAQGSYVPPRSRTRVVALNNWQQALQDRGGQLFAADSSLLTGPRMPNPEQQAVLLENGFGRPFWNGLTVTGKIEGRGRVLADMAFPDLQELVVEDISNMAIGHLNEGLLVAHGIDEGGVPEDGIGGHDEMWFVARDLAFGADAYPDVEPPESIGRPEAGKRWMPQIAPQFESMLSFLMNLLLIEFRAEIGFANTQAALLNPKLFGERRAQAEEAARIIDRIRTDEEIHVESLRLYLGELVELNLRAEDGSTIAARPLIEGFWNGLVAWAVHEQPLLAARTAYQTLKPSILEFGGSELLRAFDAVADTPEIAA